MTMSNIQLGNMCPGLSSEPRTELAAALSHSRRRPSAGRGHRHFEPPPDHPESHHRAGASRKPSAFAGWARAVPRAAAARPRSPAVPPLRHLRDAKSPQRTHKSEGQFPFDAIKRGERAAAVVVNSSSYAAVRTSGDADTAAGEWNAKCQTDSRRN